MVVQVQPPVKIGPTPSLIVQGCAEQHGGVDRAVADLNDRSAAIEREKAFGEGFNLRGVDEIDLSDQAAIGDGALPERNRLLVKIPESSDRIDRGDNCVQSRRLPKPRIGHKPPEQRSRLRQSGRLDHDTTRRKGSHRQTPDRRREIVASCATQAAVSEQNHIPRVKRLREHRVVNATAPNSFTTIAAPCIAGCSRSAAMSVVLPLPRKPVTIEIGMRSLIDSARTANERENEPAATRIPAFPRRA
jgi:hypothetical protein